MHSVDKMIEELTEGNDDGRANEENGLSFSMQIHLGRKPTRKIGQSSGI